MNRWKQRVWLTILCLSFIGLSTPVPCEEAPVRDSKRDVYELRVENTLHLAQTLHRKWNDKKRAETLYLEVLQFPFYKAPNEKQYNHQRELYLEAGRGLIELRRRNLKALQGTFFYHSAMNALKPALEEAIKQAGGNIPNLEISNFYPAGLEEMMKVDPSQPYLVTGTDLVTSDGKEKFSHSQSAVLKAYVAPELPRGTSTREEPVWGKVVNGLQLGISWQNRPYTIGETVIFELQVRNVSKHPIELTYYESLGWSPQPDVVDEQGKPLSPEQQIILLISAMGEPSNVLLSTRVETVNPGQTLVLSKVRLQIGPPDESKPFPTLHVPPGKYKITHSRGFQGPAAPTTAELKSWEGVLTAAPVTLQVLPAPR